MREEGNLRLQVHVHFICSSGRTLPGHGMCRLQPLLTATSVEGQATFLVLIATSVEGQATVLFSGCVGRSLPVVVCAHTNFSASTHGCGMGSYQQAGRCQDCSLKPRWWWSRLYVLSTAEFC